MYKIKRLIFLVFLILGFSTTSYSYFRPPENNSCSESKNSFNCWMAQLVNEEKEKMGGLATHIPTSLAVAQAVHETGYGKSYQARRKNNFFGLYYSSKKGNKLRAMKFSEPRESVRFYLNTLVTHRGYGRFRQALLQGVRNPYILSKKVARIYAEDPSYYKQVASIIRRDKLELFDNDIESA